MKERNIHADGVTLVELMIAIVLGLVICGLAYMAYNLHGRSVIYQQELAANQQDLRAAMAMIERDIRNSGADPMRSGNICNFYYYRPGDDLILPNSGYDFEDIICVWFDLSSDPVGGADPPDGDTLDAGERILYFDNAQKQLLRLESVAGGNWKNLTGDLIATSMGLDVSYTTGNVSYFSCLDTNTGTVDLNNINTVTVTLTKTGSTKDPDTGRPITSSLTRTIMVRNYGTK
jgi:hypothetical protein